MDLGDLQEWQHLVLLNCAMSLKKKVKNGSKGRSRKVSRYDRSEVALNTSRWENLLVWYSETLDSVWQPGKVKSCRVIESSRIKTVWEFTICNDIIPEAEITIQTNSMDKLNLEFQLVKKRDTNSVNMCDDMTSLAYLNEPEMLGCMQQRFSAQRIYTSIGPILIAVNPFERLGLYESDILEAYYSADQEKLRTLGPHVYQISAQAYSKMLQVKHETKRENQSVLMNGESGM
jgi:myosin heavy subunit